MTYLKSGIYSIVLNAFFVIVALIFSPYGSRGLASAQESQSAMPSGMGRLYVFREIGSFGADIDDDVTINGIPVQRLRPGAGFYCDVRPGSYVVGVLRHKADSLNLSVASGQSQYICVMLHELGGVSPRGGSLTSDQSFEVHKLEPGYGAQRIQEYRLTYATCRMP
jgi:hypothetical protein